MPSTPIKAVDSRLLPFPAESIWPVLTDLQKFPSWWPDSVGIKIVLTNPAICGSVMEICPRGGRPFRCKVESIDPPRSMRTRYEGSFVKGVGEWRIESVQGGSKVTYHLDVTADGWAVAAFSKIANLGEMHSKSMAQILANLERETATRLSLPTQNR